MPSEKSKIAIFASGSGTNAEAIMKYFLDHPSIEVAALLSNNPNAMALARAHAFAVPTFIFSRQQFDAVDPVLLWLRGREITHVVLAGFLWLMSASLIRAFPMVNLHPSLLPKFSGKGMYGMKVHEAVHRSGETETGITIHLVDERYDEGEVVLQAHCPVDAKDTPETIAGKVHRLEYENYPKAIERWIAGGKNHGPV
jgi:phosphoribosylglycinamide formyltransferase-1